MPDQPAQARLLRRASIARYSGFRVGARTSADDYRAGPVIRCAACIVRIFSIIYPTGVIFK
jgi:hypothetical protein